jgi:hypothetical protein
MSVLKNLAGAVVPVRERRTATGTLAALNAELVLDLNGDANAMLHIQSTAFIGTLEFTGANNEDETQFFPVPAYPYSPGCAGGTILSAGQPVLLHALVAANTAAVYAIPVGQLRKLRVRVSAYTSGSCVASLLADVNASLNTEIPNPVPTLAVTGTAAAAAGVTVTLPAVTGLRHYVQRIDITRSASALLTAAAAPVVVTTTNLPGTPAFTFGADAAPQGTDKTVSLDCGSGLAATAAGTNTTIVCPVTTGVIWRVNVLYRLGP